MVDVVRNTQHALEVAESVSGEEVRDTSHYLEAAEQVSGEEAHITSFYLEAAYTIGAPMADKIRDTAHALEVAYTAIFPHVNVECPFATSYIPGVVRQQTVCE